MSYFLQAFLLALKQQLRSWRVWLMALLLPALVLAVKAYLPAEEISAPVQVGVCLPQEGGDAFWNRLSSRSDGVVTFLQTDLDTLKAKVATGQWDCGLVLAEDFDRRIEALDTDGTLTLYTSAASAVYPLVQEAAACTLMEIISPGVALNYAQSKGITQSLSNIESLTQAQQVQIQMQTLSGSALAVGDLAQQTGSRLLQGCIALILLIWAVFSAMDLGSWLRSSPAQRMLFVRSPVSLLLPRAAAALIPPFLSALLGIGLLGETWLGVLALTGYLLTLGSGALLICRWQRFTNALPCLMPFIAALSLLLSPMVFDLPALYPALGHLSAWLPMTLYLTACGGSLPALGFLFLEGTLLFLLFLITGKK